MADPTLPATMLDPDSPAFNSADEAANALSAKIDMSGGESAGAVFLGPDGKYRYSNLNPGTDTSFGIRALVPKGHSLAGIIHSHPTGAVAAQNFSPDDVNVATNLKVPSYVRFGGDNQTRKFVPGTTQTQVLDTPGSMLNKRKIARGDALVLPQAPPSNTGAVTPQVVLRNDDLTSY